MLDDPVAPGEVEHRLAGVADEDAVRGRADVDVD